MEICIKSCWNLLLQSNRVREHKELICFPLLLKEVAEFVLSSAESFELVDFLNVIVGNHPLTRPSGYGDSRGSDGYKHSSTGNCRFCNTADPST